MPNRYNDRREGSILPQDGERIMNSLPQEWCITVQNDW